MSAFPYMTHRATRFQKIQGQTDAKGEQSWLLVNWRAKSGYNGCECGVILLTRKNRGSGCRSGLPGQCEEKSKSPSPSPTTWKDGCHKTLMSLITMRLPLQGNESTTVVSARVP
uniref:Uncharacterized protein n=1 Tax=Schistocephalus solidus TaxID=70667 RepID=A0A0X3NU83_SCHSO